MRLVCILCNERDCRNACKFCGAQSEQRHIDQGGYQSGNKHGSEVVNGINTSPLVPLGGGGEKLVWRKSTGLFNTLAACSVNSSHPLGNPAVV